MTHGTRYAFTKRSCRCEPCRQWNRDTVREYQREYQKRPDRRDYHREWMRRYRLELRTVAT